VLNLAPLDPHLLGERQAVTKFGPARKGSERRIGQGPVLIRKAEAADSAAIAGCLEAAFALYRDQYTPQAYADTVPNAHGVLGRMREMNLFVAVSSGAIVGTLGYTANGSEGHLRGMAVLPQWQGTGVASDLLAVVEAELRKSGCNSITLDTTEPLQLAIRFYQNRGYSRSGRALDFFGMPLYEYRKLLL
jgi:GNAT superfamily N-acetyltransferase